MRRYLKWFAAKLAFWFCVGSAIAANLPFLTPQTAGNDFLPAINQLINQLNGGPGYAGLQTAPYGIGAFCTATVAAGSTATCNGQRGQVSFTGLIIAGNTNAANQTINNSFLNAQSVCVAILGNQGGAGSAPAIVQLLMSNSAPQMAIGMTNSTATSTGSFTAIVNFWCVN